MCSLSIHQERQRCTPYRPRSYNCSSRSRYSFPSVFGATPRCSACGHDPHPCQADPRRRPTDHVGLGRTEHYQRYHRVLNRAAMCSSREAASRVLLGLLVKTFFLSEGEALLIGLLDETLERRWGAKKKIAPPRGTSGISRTTLQPRPLREGQQRLAVGVCLMLLVPTGALGGFSGGGLIGVLPERSARPRRALRSRAGQEKKPHKT